MSKAELVTRLTNLIDPKLLNDTRWLLCDKLTEYRFGIFTSYMLDVHDQLAILSKSFQSNSLCLFDIPRNLNKTLSALQKLCSTPGATEKAFLEACAENNNANCLRTCQLFNVEEGRAEYDKDRSAILDALTNHLTVRFKKVLDDPVLVAMSIFDHRRWPSDKDILEESFNDEMVLLFETYSVFFDEGSSTVKDELLEQWNALKEEIRSSTGLISRKYHDLWAHMLIHFTDEYPLPLMLVVVAMLVPTDTSECERIFSLMNDLKTSERNSLGQANLKHLMMWHIGGKPVKSEEVPVLEILKELRALAGIEGRNKHKGTAPPQYDFKVKIEVSEGGD